MTWANNAAEMLILRWMLGVTTFEKQGPNHRTAILRRGGEVGYVMVTYYCSMCSPYYVPGMRWK